MRGMTTPSHNPLYNLPCGGYPPLALNVIINLNFTVMDEKIIDLGLSEIKMITKGDTLPYKNGTRAKNGENYIVFRYNNQGFQVPENHGFVKAFDDNKNLFTVRLKEKEYDRKVVDPESGEESTVKTLAYDLMGFVTKKEDLSDAAYVAQKNAILALADPSKIDKEVLREIFAAV